MFNSGSKKKILVIVSLAMLIGGVGIGGFKLGTKGKATPAATEKSVEEEIVNDAAEGAEEKGKEDVHGAAKEGEPAKDKQDGAAPAKAEAPGKKGLFFQFEKNFTVNLLDPKGRWFVVATIKIEATSSKAVTNIEENEPGLRDATITLLNSKTKDEIMTAEDKERLKRELLARYEGFLEPNAIKNIYFTDFAVTLR